MSERTGARPEQIEAAAYVMHVKRINQPGEMHVNWLPCPTCAGQADAWAPCFVPPDHRIIGPEDLDALRRLSALCVAAKDFIESVSPWDDPDDLADVLVSRHAIDKLWNAEASTTDSHDDRRLAALIGHPEGTRE